MSKLAQALAVTAEVCGTEFSEAAAKAIINHLKQYPEENVLPALKRCMEEVTGRLTLAAIMQRIDDGRPDSETAWATAIRASDERATVVWTNETANAYWIASNLLEVGDKIGARMAFKNAYDQEVISARQQGIPVVWKATLGHDSEERENALKEAERLNLLNSSYVNGLLTYSGNENVDTKLLELVNKHKS